MSEGIIVSLINALPSFVFSLVALFALFFFKKPLFEKLGSISKVKVPGAIGLEFSDAMDKINDKAMTEIIPVKGELESGVESKVVRGHTMTVASSAGKNIELAEKHINWRDKIIVTPGDKERILKRATNHLDITKGTKILWIDDIPTNNKNEEKMLNQLGMEVDYARNTEEAIKFLKSRNCDLILSDIGREAREGIPVDSGIQTLHKLREENFPHPLIFYIGDYDPALGCPPLAFGITDRPDELLHLILDVLERRKPC